MAFVVWELLFVKITRSAINVVWLQGAPSFEHDSRLTWPLELYQSVIVVRKSNGKYSWSITGFD